MNKFQLWFIYYKLFFPNFLRLPYTSNFVLHNNKSHSYTLNTKRKSFVFWKSPTWIISVDILPSKYLVNTRVFYTIEYNLDTIIKSNIVNYENVNNDLHTIQQQESSSSSYLSDLLLFDSNSNKSFSENKNTKLEKLIEQYQDHPYIDLSRQELTDDDMKIIVKEFIIKKQCKQLWLSSNKITSIGVSILSQALNNNKTLECLDLSSNKLYDNGIYSLVNKFLIINNNNNLKKLVLANNGITDEGIKYLIEIIKINKTLTQLDLCSNKITDDGIQLLANTIEKSNSNIEILWLISNKLLTDKSINSLIQMVKYNKSLKKLWIFKCNLSTIGKEKLKELEQTNKNFKVFVNNWKD